MVGKAHVLQAAFDGAFDIFTLGAGGMAAAGGMGMVIVVHR